MCFSFEVKATPPADGDLQGRALMRSNIVMWLVVILVFTGCGDANTQPEASALSSKLAQASKEIEALKSENEKLKPASPEIKPTESPKSEFKDAEVTRIVDGDTIEIKMDGKKDTVRLLLVDTPETKDPNEPIQPFGPEASKYAEKILDGKKVRIEYDGPDRDKYKRLLAYIWIGDTTFNEMLIDEGLARVAYVYDPPYTHYDEFLDAEAKAKAAGKGIWSIDGYATTDGFVEATVPSEEQQAEPEQVEVYYKNCTAVRAAGAAPIHEGDPGYSTKLDRDRDGVACE